MTRGLLWVATHGGGLIGVDPERAAITWVVTVAEGLPSALLYGCCSAGQGQLWLGTRRGVARHTVRTGRYMVVGAVRHQQHRAVRWAGRLPSRAEAGRRRPVRC